MIVGTEGVKVGTAVVVHSITGQIKAVFLVPAVNIGAQERKDLAGAAVMGHLQLTFVEVGGWEGIEAVKFDIKQLIKQLNGDL